MSQDFYRAFEEKHRGSRELIKSRLRVYIRFVEPLKAIYPDCMALDLGCGRGEWLEVLRELGFDARGVDLDEGMLAACRELNLPAEQGEAVSTLRGLADASVGIVTGFHLAEHIPFADLQALVAEALRVLRPAGLLILETPNPENLTVGTASFYLDPTHQRPLPPGLLSFLPEHYGFARTKILRLQEAPGLSGGATVSLEQVIEGASPDYAVVAQKACDEPELFALLDPPFSQSFGVDLQSLARRYDQTVVQKLSEIVARVDRSLEFEAREGAARAELVETRELLTARDAELTQTRELLTARDTEIQRLQAHIAAQDQGWNATRGELARSQQQLLARDAELTQTRELLTARSAQLEQLKAAEQALQKDLDAAKHRIDELNGSAHRWQTAADGLNRELQRVYQSRSWRLTSGLRTANAWRRSLASGAVRYPRTGLFLLRADPVTRAAHIRLWLNNHPRAASKLRSLLSPYPRFLGWIKSKLLTSESPPPSFPVAPTFPAANVPAVTGKRRRKALTGTAADIDELMLRIEDEIARASGGMKR